MGAKQAIIAATARTAIGAFGGTLKDITAPELGSHAIKAALERAGIVANANKIPFDPRSANDPSGVRMGTPALTTRGMGADEMKTIAAWIADALKHPEDTALLERIRAEVRALCATYPLYPSPTGGNG